MNGDANIVFLSRWFPERKGMAMGVVVGGFGGGAFIFNQIQTAILNPNNVEVNEDGYFTDPDLLSRYKRNLSVLNQGCHFLCL